MSQWIWEQDWLAAGGSWNEEAAPEPRESLDAVGKGGKGKGKGKYGKGRGKGKGKGIYFQGKGGKGADKWVETPERHNCHKVGHLAWQCLEPKRHRPPFKSVLDQADASSAGDAAATQLAS